MAIPRRLPSAWVAPASAMARAAVEGRGQRNQRTDDAAVGSGRRDRRGDLQPLASSSSLSALTSWCRSTRTMNLVAVTADDLSWGGGRSSSLPGIADGPRRRGLERQSTVSGPIRHDPQRRLTRTTVPSERPRASRSAPTLSLKLGHRTAHPVTRRKLRRPPIGEHRLAVVVQDHPGAGLGGGDRAVRQEAPDRRAVGRYEPPSSQPQS